MKIITERLTITEFTPDMARAVHLGSLDGDTQRFLPDEVFPTEEIAAEVIADLTECYAGSEGPFVYPMLLEGGVYAGYVQLVPCDGGWEVGYHTVKEHTGHGYATEAVRAFLPEMMARVGADCVLGVCHGDNAASVRVLEKCGFRHVFEGEGTYQGRRCPIVRMEYRK